MTQTSEKRREVAERLRKLPSDTYAAIKEWEEDGLFIDADIHDEADYSQIYSAVFGVFPAEHMHPCDYEELHEHLADLIDPTCKPVVDDANGMDDELVCSECGCCLAITVDSKPSEPLYRYCPSCGARIVEEE